MNYRELSQSLLWRRLQREPIVASELGPAFPSSVEDAYQTAFELASMQDGAIAGYKLGATTLATRRAFSTDQVYFGPLLDWEILDASQPTPKSIALPHFRGEAEVAVCIARNISPIEARDIVDPGDLFDVWAPSLECPWSVVSNLPGAGLMALLADRCAAGALFLGPRRPFDHRVNQASFEIRSGANVLASGKAGANLVVTVEEAAMAAIRMLGKLGISVCKGSWIATGGITKCVDLNHNHNTELWCNGKREFVISAGSVGNHP